MKGSNGMAKSTPLAVLTVGAVLYLLYRGFKQYEEQQAQSGMNNIRDRLSEARALSGNSSERGDQIDRVIN